MTKKLILLASLLWVANTISFAQSTEKSNKKSNKKDKITQKKETIEVEEDEKVKVLVDGEDVTPKGSTKKSKITILVDGDKVQINGKDIEKMNSDELSEFKSNAKRFKIIAPFLREKNLNLNQNEMPEFDFDFMGQNPKNKALLGVVTENELNGAKIKSISRESAAEKAGLRINDIIKKVDDYDITSSQALSNAISNYKPKDKVKISYYRDGSFKEVEAELTENDDIENNFFMWDRRGESPSMMFENGEFVEGFNNMMNNNKPKLGAKVQDVEEGDGVKILEVENESVAAKSGLQKDDIVIEINDRTLKGVDDLRKQLRNAKPGESYNIKYSRKGVLQNTSIKFPKKLKSANL